jgi:hypothetical protein
MDFLKLFVVFLSAIGIARVIEILLTSWIKNKSFFWDEKRYLHDQLIRICAEGSTSGWQISPRDPEHGKYIANCIKKYDKKLGNKLELLVLNWSFYALLDPAKSPFVDLNNPIMKKLADGYIKDLNNSYPLILNNADKVFLRGKK